ncbi:MAG: SlyX family protein [Planctomycetota bacterium]|nr:SlyX family protein [Planctomycetota bacterium]
MDELRERLLKLEEAQAFAEHSADQVSAELLRAFEQIERLARRLDRLEQRIVELAEQEDPEAPAPDPLDDSEPSEGRGPAALQD